MSVWIYIQTFPITNYVTIISISLLNMVFVGTRSVEKVSVAVHIIVDAQQIVAVTQERTVAHVTQNSMTSTYQTPEMQV